jgi:hypothetical protein
MYIAINLRLIAINTYLFIKKWYPEIKETYLDVPILLVGTKLDRKHHLKLEKKSFSIKKSFDTPESTKKLIINNNINDSNQSEPEELDKELNDNQRISLSIENATNRINNKLGYKKQRNSNIKTKSTSSSSSNHYCFNKCNFCSTSNLEQPSRSSRSSFLSNLTSKVNISDSKTRTVSIVSKVSQQHAILSTGPLPLLLTSPSIEKTDQLIEKHTKSLIDIKDSNDKIIDVLLDENCNTNINMNDCNNFELEEYELSDFQEDTFETSELNNNCLEINNNNNNNNNYEDYDDTVDDETNQNEMINTDQISIKTNISQKTLPIDDIVEEIKEEIEQQQQQNNKIIEQLTIDNTRHLEEIAIKRRDCWKLKGSMNAKKYMECSCLNETDVFEVMNCAIGLALDYHLNKSKKTKKLSKQSSDISKKSLFNFGSFKKEITSTTTKQNITRNATADTTSLTKNHNNKSRNGDDDDDNDNEINLEEIISKRNSIKTEQKIVINADEEKKINKSISNHKKSKSSLRCLSCTRGSETQTSLNKI